MNNYSIKNKLFYIFFDGDRKSFDAKALSLAATISKKTAYKWINGTQKPQPEKVELMIIKEFGVIFGVDNWRVQNGLLIHPRYQRPISLDALPMLAMLYDNQRLHDQNRVADANRLAALETENARLRAQLMEVATRDQTEASDWSNVAHRDTISGEAPLQRPKWQLQ